MGQPRRYAHRDVSGVPPYRPPPVVGRVEAHVWSLAMRERPARPRAVPPPRTAIVEARKISASFYRYLYDTVGAPWCWTSRRLIDDEELLYRVRAPGVEIHVLWVEGVPAGFAELAGDEMPTVWLAYFGLIPEFIGRGLGRFLLDWSVDRAWDMGALELRVQTCDLDHRAALPNYERAGFRVVGERTEVIELVPGVAVNRR
jgi:GNAT superfamily N-acetyltransferase